MLEPGPDRSLAMKPRSHTFHGMSGLQLWPSQGAWIGPWPVLLTGRIDGVDAVVVHAIVLTIHMPQFRHTAHTDMRSGRSAGTMLRRRLSVGNHGTSGSHRCHVMAAPMDAWPGPTVWA